MMALVRGVMRDFTCATARLRVVGSTSTKMGTPPRRTIAAAVAKKV
jgi:hypothetical protein